MSKRAKKVHSEQVGRSCPTANDAAIRGYYLPTSRDPSAVTCSTCMAHVRKRGLAA